jgi:phosphoribosylformylglycinamidine synthase PurS subunit
VKITVFVTPKKNVLDPQGAAVGHAMESLGFKPEGPVRVGKTIEFACEGHNDEAFRARLDKLCHDLLSNPVIEDYRYTIE